MLRANGGRSSVEQVNMGRGTTRRSHAHQHHSKNVCVAGSQSADTRELGAGGGAQPVCQLYRMPPTHARIVC